jgi:hypothetical protein
MIARYLLVASVLWLPQSVIAEDSPVYESFHGVSIGRVFLSQERRNSLDKRRLEIPRRSAVAGTSAGQKKTGKSAPPAGYIIGPDGRSRTWRNGDFVQTGPNAARRMSFPGDVAVKRHPAARTSEDDGDAD